MTDEPRPADARTHIAAIAARSAGETRQLAEALQSACWPAGADRHERAAAAWLKRWRPARTGGAAPAVCGCARGRCAVCN